MTPRWIRISYLIFGLTWLTFGILKLADGDSVMGGTQLALGIGWLLMAGFIDRRAAAQSGDE